ncbi:MAG: ThiF family adenylyltransferase [Lactobacillaceae bacterium]|jgi:hypothetical protein|nr:ThiF family adenylyltransferase [Lactobacillaceae bacterium]
MIARFKIFAILPGNDLRDAIKLQEDLQKTKILLLGAGGVGSYLSLGLAQIGVGEIHLIDFDYIELSNTSRQVLYREKDIGLSKIDVAVKNLKEVAPDSLIVGHNQNIENVEQLFTEFQNINFNLIVVAADKPIGQIHRLMAEYSDKTSTPILYGSPYAQGKIYLGPLLIPGKTRSFNELFPEDYIKNDNLEIKKLNDNNISAIVDTDNSLSAKMMEVEIIKFIGKKQKSDVIESQIILNTSDWDLQKINLG